MRNLFIGSIASLILLGVIGVAVSLSGAVNVAAINKDAKPVAWFLHSTYANSVASRSADIPVPKNLKNEQQILQGARNYLAMCSGCHTPPGLSKTPVAQGLNPAPPNLAELIPHRTPAEAFWVIKNGVRMTGMPAFGPTHKDEELWALVAFLEASSDTTPAAYENLIAQAKQSAPASDGHDHRHGNGPTAAPGGGTPTISKAHGEPGHHSKNGDENQPSAAKASHGPPGHHDEPKLPAKPPEPAADEHDHQH